MASAIRLLIFGLERGTDAQSLQALLGRYGLVDYQVIDVPGQNADAFAVVDLAADRGLAGRLTARLSGLHFQGRRLQCWTTRMAWG